MTKYVPSTTLVYLRLDFMFKNIISICFLTRLKWGMKYDITNKTKHYLK